MTTAEAKQLVDQLISERVERTVEILAQLPQCKNLFDMMVREGWPEQANAFRQITVFNCMLHEDWRDREHIQYFQEHFLQVLPAQA